MLVLYNFISKQDYQTQQEKPKSKWEELHPRQGLRYIPKEYNKNTLYYPKDLSYKEATELLIGLKYSFGDELAIQRQQQEKPDEYKAYYNYCEACKVKAREFITIKENWNNQD